jgi:hypothetical protein
MVSKVLTGAGFASSRSGSAADLTMPVLSCSPARKEKGFLLGPDVDMSAVVGALMDAKERPGALDVEVDVGWMFFSAGTTEVAGFASDDDCLSSRVVEVELSLLRKEIFVRLPMSRIRNRPMYQISNNIAPFPNLFVPCHFLP